MAQVAVGSRRRFLKGLAAAAGAAASPWIVPARVLGKDGAVAPSSRITLGVIGYGPRCTDVMSHFMTFPEIQLLGVADVRQRSREQCKKVIDAHHKNGDCKTYNDLRELLARDDIQATLIATGNRWHGIGSILAARAGKDIYCEKPVCLTLEEGRAVVDTCRRLGTIYQAGHQRRSTDSYRFQVEVVRKGLIGKLKRIVCQVWNGAVCKAAPPQPVPPGLDWDLWLGATPWHPYSQARHAMWSCFWDTGDGMMTDMGCHYTDIAQWGHDSDTTGPTEFEGEAVFDPSAYSETPISGEFRATYADGVQLVMTQKGAFHERLIRFEGSDGWIQVDDHTNLVTAQPASLLRLRTISARSWAHVGDHIGNFLQAIRTRQQPICPPETAFRAQTICLVGTIGIRLGRKLKWDPASETFVGDADANRMRSRAMRAPWHL